jgi:hypothetical protein
MSAPAIFRLVVFLTVACLVPATAQPGPQALHMRLVGHVDMNSGGEGMAMKIAPGGRWILYVAHEAPPKCFMVVDVTNPANPKVIEDTDAPLPTISCNSLDVSGDILVVAAETPKEGEPGGGIRVYGLADPLHPKLLSYFDLSGPYSRGTHHVWLESPTRAHIATGASDFRAKRRGKDDRFYMSVDLSDPAHPRELGRWWYPGQRENDPEPAPGPIPQGGDSPQNVQPHNIDVFPSHPDRAYIGYVDGGIVILDIHDIRHPKPVSIVTYLSPGYTHTVFPLFSRKLLAVSEEATGDHCSDGAHRISLWDVSDETKPRLISVAPFAADTAALCKNGGRYGAHNIFEDKPYGPTYKSDRYIIGSFFAGGVRIFDTIDPKHIVEAAYYVPAPSPRLTKGQIQINDVFADDRGYVYACDRFNGGLYILQSDVLTKPSG